MTTHILATFNNGVFVPESHVDLPAGTRVSLVVEPAPAALPAADEPNVPATRPDPFRYHRRIEIDPELAREIASSPEFLPEEC